jgi:hypothetical protein
MARVILEVPTEKMQPFLQLITKLGLEKHAIASGYDSNEIKRSTGLKKYQPFKLFAEKFLLFDWEFFSNELEFE